MSQFGIGIMQGRLSPQVGDKTQFFPRYEDIENEFYLARGLGFDHVCWYVDHKQTPYRTSFDQYLYAVKHVAWLQELVRTTPINSIELGKYRFDTENASNSVKEIDCWLSLMSSLCCGVAVLPLLEGNSIGHYDQDLLAARLALIADRNPTFRIALELDISALETADFLRKVDHPRVGVCYDVGNAVSYGFNVSAELGFLGSQIFEIHLKDRKVGSHQSVPLGSGDVNFRGLLGYALKNYCGRITMQAYRSKDTYLQDAYTQLKFIKDIMEEK